MLENTKGAIKKGQSRETGNTGYTRRRKTEQTHNTIYAGHHYVQTNTNNVNKTWSLLLTTGGIDITIRNSERNVYLTRCFSFTRT